MTQKEFRGEVGSNTCPSLIAITGRVTMAAKPGSGVCSPKMCLFVAWVNAKGKLWLSKHRAVARKAQTGWAEFFSPKQV